MKTEEFCYWLQGMFELCDPKALDERQTDLIKRHLALVFQHDIDPKAGPPEVQQKLNEAHSGLQPGTLKIGGAAPGGGLYRC